MKCNELKAEMIRRGVKRDVLADKIGISTFALDNKVHGKSQFKTNELLIFVNELHLNAKQLNDFVFNGEMECLKELDAS